MSTCKFKLNPHKTKFILFGSKRQRDKLKAFFPTVILGCPLGPTESLRILECGSILTFSCSHMFRMSAKVALCN